MMPTEQAVDRVRAYAAQIVEFAPDMTKRDADELSADLTAVLDALTALQARVEDANRRGHAGGYPCTPEHTWKEWANECWRDAQRAEFLLALMAAAAEDQSRWFIRMADIREASGVGVKPMLGEVAEAIRAKFAATEQRVGELEAAGKALADAADALGWAANLSGADTEIAAFRALLLTPPAPHSDEAGS